MALEAFLPPQDLPHLTLHWHLLPDLGEHRTEWSGREALGWGQKTSFKDHRGRQAAFIQADGFVPLTIVSKTSSAPALSEEASHRLLRIFSRDL